MKIDQQQFSYIASMLDQADSIYMWQLHKRHRFSNAQQAAFTEEIGEDWMRLTIFKFAERAVLYQQKYDEELTCLDDDRVGVLKTAFDIAWNYCQQQKMAA